MKHYEPKKIKVKFNKGRLTANYLRDTLLRDKDFAIDSNTKLSGKSLADIFLRYLDENHSGYVNNQFRRFKTYRVSESFLDHLHTSGVFGLIPMTIQGYPYYRLRDSDKAEVPEEYVEIAMEVYTG